MWNVKCLFNKINTTHFIYIFEIIPQLTTVQRAQIVALSDEGISKAELARQYHVSCTAISKLLMKHSTHGTFYRIPGSARPRLTTERQDRRIG